MAAFRHGKGKLVIEPELKEFIERAIVPALVRQYLAEMDSEKQIAENGRRVAKFRGSSTANVTLEGGARP